MAGNKLSQHCDIGQFWTRDRQLLEQCKHRERNQSNRSHPRDWSWLTYLKSDYTDELRQRIKIYQEIVSLAHIFVQSLPKSSLPLGESFSELRSQIILEIKPPFIFLRHSICCSTNTSVVEDDLVDEVTVRRALEFGNREGELGNVRRDIIYPVVRGLLCSIAADNQSLHLIGFEVFLGSDGCWIVEGISWLRDERVRRDWWDESMLWLHDGSKLMCTQEAQFLWSCEWGKKVVYLKHFSKSELGITFVIFWDIDARPPPQTSSRTLPRNSALPSGTGGWITILANIGDGTSLAPEQARRNDIRYR